MTLWNSYSTFHIFILFVFKGTVHCLEFNPNNPSILAAGDNGHKVKVWHIDDKEEFQELACYNHIAIVGLVKWSPEDSMELIVGSFSMYNDLFAVNF